MHKQIYVNLPVKDLARSRRFFAALGYGFDERFSDDNAVALVLGENLYAMLLTEPFFAGFVDRPVVDAREAVEAIVCVSCDRREEVDALIAKAVAAGGRALREPKDHGFMYEHGFVDPDGHHWSLMHMPHEPGEPA